MILSAHLIFHDVSSYFLFFYKFFPQIRQTASNSKKGL